MLSVDSLTAMYVYMCDPAFPDSPEVRNRGSEACRLDNGLLQVQRLVVNSLSASLVVYISAAASLSTALMDVIFTSVKITATHVNHSLTTSPID